MAAAFPRRLFEILTDEDKAVICWNADGKSFRINDPNVFCNDVLPRYYRHCKLTSFQRQLNLYGFQRVHVGPLGGAYYHPHFQRDNFSLLMNMKRTAKRTVNDDEQRDVSPSHSSASLPFLESFPSMPNESIIAARRASDAAELAVKTAAEVMAAMMTPFIADTPHGSSATSSVKQEDSDFSGVDTTQAVGVGNRVSLKAASASSMNSEEWLQEADLHVDSRSSLLSADKTSSDEFGADEVRKFSRSRRNSSEMSDCATLMEFDINQLETMLPSKSSSPPASLPSGVHEYQRAYSEPARKYQKDINGLAAKSWEFVDEKVSLPALSQLVQDAPVDSLNTSEYIGLADDLTKSIGSRKALTLVLALLARTANAPSSSSTTDIEGSLDSLDPERAAAELHNLSLYRRV